MEVGVRELRDHLNKHVEAVCQGDEVSVTDQGKGIARLFPPDRPRSLDRLIEEGLVTAQRAPKRRREGHGIRGAGSVSDLVAEPRR